MLSTQASNRRIHQIIDTVKKGQLKPSPDFQRRLVWNNGHKSNFIDTVLKNLPFPEIYVCQGEVDAKTAESIEWLVDGQQRVMTIIEYFNGAKSLKLAKGVPSYRDLPEEEKKQFLAYTVVVRDLGNLPLDEVKEIFERINSTSYSLNAMEVQNARYEGEFKSFGEVIAESDFFERHKVFSASEVKRMKDLRFILTLVATCLSTYFARDNKIEEFLEKYNDVFDEAEQTKNILNSVFNYIEECKFSEGSRAWLKADFFSLVVELFRKVKHEAALPDPAIFGSTFNEFLNYVAAEITNPGSIPDTYEFAEDARDYTKHVSSNTNDRKTRIERGEIVSSLIDSRVS